MKLGVKDSVRGVLDQATLSAATFGTQILLLFWMPIDEYGRFAIAYAILALFLAVHQALFQQPMVVFSAGRFATAAAAVERAFLSSYLRYWFAPSLGLALILYASATFFEGTPSWKSYAAAIAASCPFLLMHLLRRIWHGRARHALLLAGNVCYLTFLGSALVLLHASGGLNAHSAVLAVLLAALSTCTLWLYFLKAKASHRPEPAPPGLLRETIEYSRWALPSQGALWLMDNGPLLVAGLAAGLVAAGTVRAVATFLLPFLHVVVGVANLLIISSARIAQTEPLALRREFKRSSGLLIVGAGIYSAAVMAFVVFLNQVAGVAMPFDPSLLVLGLMLPPLWALQGGGIAILRALERPRAVFVATAGGALVGLPFLALLTWKWGASGAVIGWSAMTAVSTLVVLVSVATRVRDVEAAARGHVEVAAEAAR